MLFIFAVPGGTRTCFPGHRETRGKEG